MAQGRWVTDASFGLLLSLFYFILCLISILRYYLCFKGFREVAVEETGPNDMSGIIWAISKFFFKKKSYSINSNNYI